MSVRSIIADLKSAIGSRASRDFQYRSHVIDFTFNYRATFDELYFVIENELINFRGRGGTGLSTTEASILESTCRDSIRRIYTRRNIIKVHRNNGYKVITGQAGRGGPGTVSGEQLLAQYTGFMTDAKGVPIPNQGNRLACLIKRLQPNQNGIVVTYAGSMENWGRTSNHRNVINALWYSVVRLTLRDYKRRILSNPRSTPVEGSARRIGSFRGRSRAIRLHGPNASKSPPLSSSTGMLNTGIPTGFQEDTSVPVVAMIDALKELDANKIAKAADLNLSNPRMYDIAFQDILNDLDVEFSVNSETISDIVNLNKVIRIKLEQGGQIHQTLMEHADRVNVNSILDLIETKLLNSQRGLSNPDYATSTPFSKRAEQLLIASLLKQFGKTGLDMRTKYSKALVLALSRKQKESSSGNFNLKRSGRKNKGKTLKAKGGRNKRATAARSTTTTQSNQQSAIALKELLNNALPEMLLPKMQTPALVNRTGRFRHSAEVTNVRIGPKGGTQIDYTYQRNPYEVFELGSGSPLATTDRDPRKIIGGTIREIAQQIMGNKFITTRRV